jgi:hypothetical protein
VESEGTKIHYSPYLVLESGKTLRKIVFISLNQTYTRIAYIGLLSLEEKEIVFELTIGSQEFVSGFQLKEEFAFRVNKTEVLLE